MKLGNYTWMVCNKCGKRYAHVPGGKPHRCGKLDKIGFNPIIEKLDDVEKKFSLSNIAIDFQIEFEEGDEIQFLVEPSLKHHIVQVKKDERFGLYINEEDNYFQTNAKFYIYRNGKRI